MSNQSIYDSFRKAYPEFVYERYGYDVQSDGLHIVFTFRMGDSFVFTPSAVIPRRNFLCFDQPDDILDTLVFNIGMIELISYWKCICPPVVTVRCGHLSESQILFWKKLYFNGLGEFFYINGIHATLDDFLQINSCEETEFPCRPIHPAFQHPSNHLVPIGGGKDSVVTLELLSSQTPANDPPQHQPVPLIMNPRGATVGCIQAAGYTMDDVLVIQRSIHPLLLDLNSQGYLNGHTPFSAMLAFYTLLAAQLSGIPNVALSNESSANESTVVGTGINHQYSKSLEFENDFRQYVSEFISPAYNYFSFLRPLSELQIAMLFSRYSQYFSVFRSCNAGSKQDIWCGKCAKCLFAYIILSPFIAPQQLNAIFGKNMLDDPDMQHFLLELTGQAETKPFECVGTIDEVNTALCLTLNRWYPDQRPTLLRNYSLKPSHPANLSQLLPDHNLTPSLINLLQKNVQAATT